MRYFFNFCIILNFIISPYIYIASAADEEKESSKKHICLMDNAEEYTSQEWLQDFLVYTKQKGIQQYRLETDTEYTSSYVRFTGSQKSLAVGYGLLIHDKTVTTPKLELKQTKYEKLSLLGTSIKIINGYLNNLDESEKTFTPDKTNVFVAHISYVIQWSESAIPELVPGGMLHNQEGHPIVIMSGAGVEETDSTIEQFYNHIYKKDGPDISVFSGNKVAELYVPYVLNDAVVKDKLPVFQGEYLAKMAEDLRINFPYTKVTADERLQAKNRIYTTCGFLNLLFKNKFDELFKSRKDTTKILLDDFIMDSNIQIESEEPDSTKFKLESFLSVLKDNKRTFFLAAIERLKQESHNLIEEEKTYIKNIRKYMEFSVNPQSLIKFKNSLNFWKIIKALETKLLCPNPDSEWGSSISVAQRLKKYALKGFNGSHTEPLFIKLIKTNPELLIQDLPTVLDENKDKLSDAFNPKFLGIIIDSFSWLDTCSNCGDYLHSNNLWSESLKEVSESDKLQGFQLPFHQIGSLFRILAQEPYTSMPSDIESSGGGSDYSKSGWDYRVLSELRYTLATRRPSKEKLLRDKTFERIPTAVTTAALTKPLEFWITHSALTINILTPIVRPFSINAIDILFLKFPNEKALRIKKLLTAFELASQDRLKFEEVYQLAKPLVEEPLILNENDRKFMSMLISQDVLKSPAEYVKTYFSRACLRQAKHSFKSNKSTEGWKYLRDFAVLGVINAQNDNSKLEDPIEVTTFLVKYWKNGWSAGKKRANYSTPHFEDRYNSEESITLFCNLIYKSTYYLLEGENKKIKKILKEHDLQRPKKFNM